MSSNAQVIANRANAQFSTGPKTAQGKARVSQNRATHCLSGRHVILPGEDAEAYDRLVLDLTLELAPRGTAEQAIVDGIAHAQWKLNRIALWEEVEDAAGANPANLSWPFVNRLSDAGRAAAGRWRAPDVPAAAGGQAPPAATGPA